MNRFRLPLPDDPEHFWAVLIALFLAAVVFAYMALDTWINE